MWSLVVGLLYCIFLGGIICIIVVFWGDYVVSDVFGFGNFKFNYIEYRSMVGK